MPLLNKTQIMKKNLSPNEEMIQLALEAGIKDRSYSTPRQGWVESYLGEAIIEYKGQKYKVIGHDTEGCPMTVTREGYIEFIPVN